MGGVLVYGETKTPSEPSSEEWENNATNTSNNIEQDQVSVAEDTITKSNSGSSPGLTLPGFTGQVLSKDLNENTGQPYETTNTYISTDERINSIIHFEPLKEKGIVEWRWYNPDGELYDTFSDMAGKGWDWVYCYMPIREKISEIKPGEWNVDFLFNNEVLDRKQFSIGLPSHTNENAYPNQYQASDEDNPDSEKAPGSSLPPSIIDHTLSKTINEYTEEISQECNTFSWDDRGIVSSIRFDNLTTPPDIEWEWYDPNGNLQYDSLSQPKIGKKVAYQFMWMKISPELTGVWMVKVLLDGEVIDTKTFTIIPGETTTCDRTCGGQCCPEGMKCCNDMNTGPTCYDPSTATCDIVYGSRSGSTSCGTCPSGWSGPDKDCMCTRWSSVSTSSPVVQPQITIGPDPMAPLSMDFGHNYKCNACPPGWSGPDENCECWRWVYTYN